MLVYAELLRYWLHRFTHTWALLWPLHAVQHSPEKLYWLNVGRFHPLEKALQLVLDALPFMLLGVGEQVISLYFVFYAINGFCQHSNIRLRHGALNYLISTTELHRWHDSRISDIGLSDRDYPKSFAAQMRTPFLPGITGDVARASGRAKSLHEAKLRNTQIPWTLARPAPALVLIDAR